MLRTFVEGRLIDFASLYERHAEAVYRFALYLSGDRMSAEDIVSETFVRVWGARERVELATVRAYLLAIARNVYLHGKRHDHRMEEISETIPDPTVGAGELHEHATALEDALSALQTLPEIDRSAVLLRSQELSYEEIATALGLAPVAVRVRVHRARAKLGRLKEIGWDD